MAFASHSCPLAAYSFVVVCYRVPGFPLVSAFLCTIFLQNEGGRKLGCTRALLFFFSFFFSFVVVFGVCVCFTLFPLQKRLEARACGIIVEDETILSKGYGGVPL